MAGESIRIVFERDGEPLAVDFASRSEGVRLFGEVAAWPRRMAVSLFPRFAGTKAQLERVVQRMGRFALDVTANDDGHLVLSGEGSLDGGPNDNLPPGAWGLTSNLYPFGRHRVQQLFLASGDEVALRVPLGREPGKITVRDPADWDPEVRRVLEASELDRHLVERFRRETGAEWIQNELRWARRRACLLNVLGVCREVDLIRHVRQVFLVEVDRAYIRVDPGLVDSLDSAAFVRDGGPVHPIHRRLLQSVENATDDGWRLDSWRHDRNPSMQIVIAREKNAAGSDPPTFAELDIDLGNPRVDLFGLFTHLGEVVHPGRTDHIRLHGELVKTGARDFLAYEPG